MNNTTQPFEYFLIEEVPAGKAKTEGAAAAPTIMRVDSRSSSESPATPVSADTSASPMLATFERIYESIDRRLCMFETAEGHLACVQASRLV